MEAAAAQALVCGSATRGTQTSWGLPWEDVKASNARRQAAWRARQKLKDQRKGWCGVAFTAGIGGRRRRWTMKSTHAREQGDYARQKRLDIKKWILEEQYKAQKHGMQVKFVLCPMGLKPYKVTLD